MHRAMLPLRHWHFGRPVIAGPDYQDLDQFERDGLLDARLIEPDDADLRAWARSCCLVYPSEDDDPLEGWSPGRSIVARLDFAGDFGGMVQEFYYKHHDDDECDAAADPTSTDAFNEDPTRWLIVWEKFLSCCIHWELHQGRFGLVMEVTRREVNHWADTICVELATSIYHPVRPGCARSARDELVANTKRWHLAAMVRRAALLDARVFQHMPELVVLHIVQRSRRAA